MAPSEAAGYHRIRVASLTLAGHRQLQNEKGRGCHRLRRAPTTARRHLGTREGESAGPRSPSLLGRSSTQRSPDMQFEGVRRLLNMQPHRDHALGLRARPLCAPGYERPALTSGDSAGFGVLHHRDRTLGVRGRRRRRSPVLARNGDEYVGGGVTSRSSPVMPPALVTTRSRTRALSHQAGVR